MRHIDVYLSSLEKRFGKPRGKFPIIDLEIEFKVQDLTEMVRIIASSIFEHGMPRIQVGRVKTGGPKKAAAWIQLLEHVPLYGSDAFRETRIQLCVRSELFHEAPFQTVSFAIAHELSHLILFSVGETEHDEKYVDLLAMYFGFAEIYVKGRSFNKHDGLEWNGSIQHLQYLSTTSVVGYLSDEEAQYACKVIALKRR